jgi:hypothetical protein
VANPTCQQTGKVQGRLQSGVINLVGPHDLATAEKPVNCQRSRTGTIATPQKGCPIAAKGFA